MNVFISWSKERSKHVALALRDWLPNVLQNAKPWMSRHDIGAGARWGQELDVTLETTDFGILCVTPENASEPWLIYEAGALGKRVSSSRVVPYLIGMEGAADIPEGPLTRFQAKIAMTETFDVIKEINAAMGERSLPERTLVTVYEKWWPDLEAKLKTIPQPAAEVRGPDSDNMVREILDAVRDISRRSVADQEPTNALVGDQVSQLMAIWDPLNAILTTRGVSLRKVQRGAPGFDAMLVTPSGPVTIPLPKAIIWRVEALADYRFRSIAKETGDDRVLKPPPEVG